MESLEPGMIVILTAGEQVPADLEVLKGSTACDESNLTGESRPISKETGDILLSGTMNLWGAVEGRVLRKASESALRKIVALIREAQGMKAPSQRFTDRFGTTYTWAILSLCLAMFFLGVAVALGTVVVMTSAPFLFPIPLAVGVAAHEGSTVLMVLNSLRLLLGGRA